MLIHLHIENFILIDQLSLDVSQDFTTITGETGAGKSILLGAIGLIQGKRADLSAIRDTNRKCIVEAHFNIANLDLIHLFSDFDLDYEKITIVRREILPSGKSRAFINDTPVKLSVLNRIAAHLIDVHSQHETLELGTDTFQMDLLHSFIVHKTKDLDHSAAVLLNNYKSSYQHFKTSMSSLKQLREDEARLTRESDYNQFLLDELEAAQLDHLDLNDLKKEYEQLSHVEFIKEKVIHSQELLFNDELGVLEQLRSVYNNIQSLSSFGKFYNDISIRLNSALIELEDAGSEMLNNIDSLEVNPERLQQISDVLSIVENLFKKHQKHSITELIAVRDHLADSVFNSQNISSSIKRLEQEIIVAKKELLRIGGELTNMRRRYAPELSKQIIGLIQQLGMPDAIFQIDIVTLNDFQNHGLDQVCFKFTANKGVPVKLLNKVASGGELSRLMLSIKSLLSKYKKLPTIIFDEIDTGVSGTVGDQMAQIMQSMCKEMQVIAITHLPQIAAAGSSHLKVIKSLENDTAVSKIKLLNTKERIEEIAQMLSAGSISNAARENARVLLG